MYDQIADYYDLTHADLTADVPCILKVAEETSGPVLELGCGSGRLLLPLAQAGFEVTGLDQSSAMLARGRKRLEKETAAVRKRVTLIERDMIDFELDGRYPLILISYNTFMHLDSVQAAAALKRVKAHLPGDGRCFIDLDNPFTLAATPEDQLLSLENTLVDPDTGDTILHFAANRLDTARQTLHITWIYDRSPAGGGPIQRTVAQTVYYYRYPHQMELLLREAGFTRITFLGDYEETPFREDSERFLILCQL